MARLVDLALVEFGRTRRPGPVGIALLVALDVALRLYG